MSSPVSLLTATALLLSGCATTVEPRAFLPVVQPPPTDMAAFEGEFSSCASQASADVAVFYGAHPELKPVKEGDFDFTPTGGGAIGPGDMGSGGLALIGLIIAAFSAGGRSHTLQAHQQATEQDIQAAMTACLKARGHTVTAWRLAKNDEALAAKFQTPTQPTGRALTLREAQQAERFAEGDPRQRAEWLKMAAERYERLAEGAGDPQERARYVGKAADARHKAEEPGPPLPEKGPYVTLRVPPYAAAPGVSALSEAPQRTFAVEMTRDARPGLHLASRIGEETTLGGMPLNEVETIPPPAQLLQDVFSAELGAAGHRPSADIPDVRIVPEMRRFDLSTHVTLFYSDVNAAIDVAVNLQAPQQPGGSRDYSARCTGRAKLSLGADLMTRVVVDCLKQVGDQFRQDAAVRDFMNATRSKQ